MPEYLAIISGTAVEYGFGGNTPYDVHETIRFNVENEELAKVKAKKRLSELRRELLCPEISLKSLERVASISLD